METTDEFMERFRATGLDMLCEARRRDEQFSWRWSAPITRSWSAAGPSWQQVPKGMFDFSAIRPRGDAFRDMWLNRETPSWQFIDFDINAPMSEMTVTGRPPLRDYQKAVVEALEQQRSIVVTKGRSCGLSYSRQAWAAALFGLNYSDLENKIVAFDLEAYPQEFIYGGTRRSARLYDPIKPWTEAPLPPAQSLGPGKEVETPGARRVDAKRVAKDRLKRKMAKKSKRK